MSGPPGRRPQRTSKPGRAGKKPKPIYKPSRKSGGTRHQPGTPTRNGNMCRTGKVIGAAILAFIAASVVATLGAAVFA